MDELTLFFDGGRTSEFTGVPVFQTPIMETDTACSINLVYDRNRDNPFSLLLFDNDPSDRASVLLVFPLLRSLLARSVP
jgi:hypothetical protein